MMSTMIKVVITPCQGTDGTVVAVFKTKKKKKEKKNGTFLCGGGSQTDDICVRFSSTPPRPTVDPSRCSVAQVWIYVCVAFGPRRVACYYSGVSV